MLKNIHTQFSKQLETVIKQEVDGMLEEEKVIPLLEDLEKIVADSPDRIAWRPSGDVDADMRSHLMPIKVRQKQKLQRILTSIEEENKSLEKAMAHRQKHLEASQKKLEAKTQNIHQTYDTCWGNMALMSQLRNSLIQQTLQ
ncbi:unnamed protein product [Owenia fusiformis]|nr:unnamed protein product [Owenia fusiformis]